MQSLFRKKVKQIAKIAEGSFSYGLPAKCRFVNGWFCVVCNDVTEHWLVDGCQVCSVCGTAKAQTVPTQFLERAAYESAICHYSARIEFEAVEKVGPELGEDRNASWYIMVRSQLHSIKKLDEAIKNASCKHKKLEAVV